NTVLQGKNDFSRKWGSRSLTDNWRWSELASANVSVVSNTQEEGDTPQGQQGITDDTKDQIDPRYNPDFYLAQIPTDEEELKRLKLDRDNAYYQLGLLYSDRLEEYEVAAGKLEHLLSINPETGLIPHAKYHLYKIYLKIDSTKAQAMHNDIHTNPS